MVFRHSGNVLALRQGNLFLNTSVPPVSEKSSARCWAAMSSRAWLLPYSQG